MHQGTTDRLVALSQWIDAGNAHRDPEAVTWGRLAKLAEEQGEVIEAFIGATGQNPRKGITCTLEAVLEELLDVAVTALGAYEHIDGHQGRALDELAAKIYRVAERAGVTVDDTQICSTCGDEYAYCDGSRHYPTVQDHADGSADRG